MYSLRLIVLVVIIFSISDFYDYIRHKIHSKQVSVESIVLTMELLDDKMRLDSDALVLIRF